VRRREAGEPASTSNFDVSAAAVVELPLRGEWCALNTPAHRIPSHGTDYFAQRYAYDFARVGSEGMRFQPGSMLRHLTAGVPASQFFCWDQPVEAAFSGQVVAVGDGWPDRRHVAALWEILRGTFFARPPRDGDYRPLAGNYVLVAGVPGVALYAHLRCGSVSVLEGESIAAGAMIGSVGNSGNSTMPHLHFHLMDGPDPLRASGVPCVFRRYEAFVNGEWVSVHHGAPNRLERIRATGKES
jgi:hypothetical protein